MIGGVRWWTIKNKLLAQLSRHEIAWSKPCLRCNTFTCLTLVRSPSSAHALNNYLTIIGGVAELLQESLAAHPDPQIHTWLAGLQHATDLMTHTVSRLMSNTMTQDIQLRFEQTDLSALVQKVCRYYQRIADHKDIHIIYNSLGEVPPVDRPRSRCGGIGQPAVKRHKVFAPWKAYLDTSAARPG